jgi:hypothetical protein
LTAAVAASIVIIRIIRLEGECRLRRSYERKESRENNEDRS